MSHTDRIEPPVTTWQLPDVRRAAAGSDLLGVGADLESGTILAAYRRGLFPMPVENVVGWWSPDPRGVIPLDNFHASRSLHRSARTFKVTFDTAFDQVVAGCADPQREHGWITPEIAAAYSRLAHEGWAHSVEVWDRAGELVGGLYGVEVGGLFAGESMFHLARDASKVAVWAVVAKLVANGGPRLLDIQWLTPHLASLGASEIERTNYLDRLDLALPLDPAF